MHAPALSARSYLRSIEASASSLGKPHVKLLTLVDRVNDLTDRAPYAIIGGLAQILWARKTHTEDLDVAVASASLHEAAGRIRRGRAPAGWRLPRERSFESDDVFEVAHLLYRGSVVDLIAFRDSGFNDEIMRTAVSVPDLGNYRFVRPELLVVMQLLRSTRKATLAAIDLIVSRQDAGDFDLRYARRWAARTGKEWELRRALASADEL